MFTKNLPLTTRTNTNNSLELISEDLPFWFLAHGGAKNTKYTEEDVEFVNFSFFLCVLCVLCAFVRNIWSKVYSISGYLQEKQGCG